MPFIEYEKWKRDQKELERKALKEKVIDVYAKKHEQGKIENRPA